MIISYSAMNYNSVELFFETALMTHLYLYTLFGQEKIYTNGTYKQDLCFHFFSEQKRAQHIIESKAKYAIYWRKFKPKI